MEDKIIQVSGFSVKTNDWDYLLVALTESGKVLLSVGDGDWLNVGPSASQPSASPDPHEIWAAAQLMPDEGIEDGVRRISEIVGSGEK